MLYGRMYLARRVSDASFDMVRIGYGSLLATPSS